MESDVSVICDQSKVDDKGCNGAPDWIIEVVSSSCLRMDYMTKLFQYRTAGVRVYWIVDLEEKKVLVYSFGEEEDFIQYSFDEEISIRIYDRFKMNIAELL